MMKKWLLALAGLCTAGLLCIGYGFFVEPKLLTITRYTLPTNGKTEALRIAFISDTHFGKNYHPKQLDRIVDRINQEKPDLILFGGDFFDNWARDCQKLDREMISSKLAEMNAPLGKYAVWGNHDYGGGASRIYEEMLTAGGFSLLINQDVCFPEQGLQIYGLDDVLLGDPSYEFQSDPKNFRMIIGHEPAAIDHLPVGYADLMLAGHSHGGQIFLPILTDYILPVGSGSYRKGLYRADNGTSLIVSSGIGMTILPARFANPPEICIIDLIP